MGGERPEQTETANLGEGDSVSGCHHDGCFGKKEKNVGESKQQAIAKTAAKKGAVPFNAVHVPNSGDIEDADKHYIMPNKLRHTELKQALFNKSEKPEEEKTAAIAVYQKMDQAEAKRKAKHAKLMKLIHSKLKAHHLMQDTEGRLVPDVLLAMPSSDKEDAGKDDIHEDTANIADAHDDDVSDDDERRIGDATDDEQKP